MKFRRLNKQTAEMIQRVDLDLFRLLFEQKFSKRFICVTVGINWKQFMIIREHLGLEKREGEV